MSLSKLNLSPSALLTLLILTYNIIILYLNKKDLTKTPQLPPHLIQFPSYDTDYINLVL